MELPDLKSAVWKNVVTGKIPLNSNFLAAKMLISRVQTDVKNDPSPKNIDKAIGELYELFNKYKDLPTLSDDIQKLNSAGN
jgi:hypothetical protein